MQGRLVGNDGADYLSSQNMFRNHKVADELIPTNKAEGDKAPSIATDGQLVKVHERHESFKYLGKFLTVTGEPQIHVDSLLQH